MSDENTPADPKPKRGAPAGGPQGKHGFKKGEYDPRRAVGANMRRTKDGKSVTGLAREYTEEALLKQVEIMRDPNTPAREALKAAENIISRGWGSATQNVDINASVKHEHEVATIDFAAISQEARLQLLSAVKNLPMTGESDQIADADFTFIENSRENDESDD